MGSEGSILDMIIRYRNNMNLLRTTRFGKSGNRFREARKAYYRAASGKLDFKKATPEELQAIRLKIRKQKRNNALVFVSLLIIVLVFISFGIFKMVSGAREDNLRAFEKHALLKKSKSEKLANYISTGDSLYKLNDWAAAYFFYSQAQKLVPNNYEIEYRLALAKTSECAHKRMGCIEAGERLEKLIRIFPDSAELYRLRVSKAFTLGDTASANRDFKILDDLDKNY
jgi:tetratricopeptide (TPR) repeat protein